MIEPDGILLLPRLRVQNANAASSPLTWGFPSPSAFTGFAHALHRRITDELELSLEGVAIICHHFEPQASTPAGRRNQVFHLTRNPVDKNGRTAAIVEEARAHMEVSLLLGVTGAGLFVGTPLPALAERVHEVAMGMRLAGGSVMPFTRPWTRRERPSLELWAGTSEEAAKLSKRLARRLLPGFALVSRERLLDQRWAQLRAINPDASLLDAFLELSSVNIDPPNLPLTGTELDQPDVTDDPVQGEWTIRRKRGWLVPIAAGFRAISELYESGEVANTRDRVTPFRFVEGIYTIGEWLSPHRIDDVRKLLWVHGYDPEEGLYRWMTPHFASVLTEEGT